MSHVSWGSKSQTYVIHETARTGSVGTDGDNDVIAVGRSNLDSNGDKAMSGTTEVTGVDSQDTIEAIVVDDSRFMRTAISGILEDGNVDVIAEASDGKEAVDAVTTHEPDVVTMDIEMPRVDGIEAVERIMEQRPTPVLMLSAHTDGDSEVTFEALEKGAVDFFTKPGGEVSTAISRHEEQLVEKVRSAARADLDAVAATAEDGRDVTVRSTERDIPDSATLILGASTGGPNVVERILENIPLAADLRILVVQHMPDEFTGRFADRLDRASAYDVGEAADGDRIGGGEALVARGGYHMVVSAFSRGRLRVRLTEDEPVNGVRPAIDVTMESAAQEIDGPLTGVVLTGMGADGADGVRDIAAAGGTVIAQDEATSTVFGMPKRAIETGVVDATYPVEEIADGILDSFSEDRDP